MKILNNIYRNIAYRMGAFFMNVGITMWPEERPKVIFLKHLDNFKKEIHDNYEAYEKQQNENNSKYH